MSIRGVRLVSRGSHEQGLNVFPAVSQAQQGREKQPAVRRMIGQFPRDRQLPQFLQSGRRIGAGQTQSLQSAQIRMLKPGSR